MFERGTSRSSTSTRRAASRRTTCRRIVEHWPVTYLANVNTPVLLPHHEGDLRCPIAQSEEIFHALKAMGKEVEFVRYPGGFHTYVTHAPSQVADRIKRQIAWFEGHKTRRPSRALRHGSGQASG